LSTLRYEQEILPGRVLFGPGRRVEVPRECQALGLRRLLVVGDPWLGEAVEELTAGLGERCVATVTDVAQHVPAERAEACVATAKEVSADGVVVMGGGSSTGLAKIVGLELGLPVVAIPTTLAGSEMTPIFGITEEGAKRTGRDLRVLPRVVVYDPELQVSLPAFLTAVSGMNALAHCAEALWMPSATPVTDAVATEGITRLARGLPASVARPGDLDARAGALSGAQLAGMAFGALGSGLHHKACHLLGGSFGLPHAETHSALLAHVAAYNAETVPAAMERMSRALGAEGIPAPAALYDLAASIGATTSLGELGFREESIPEVVEALVSTPPPNPRAMDQGGLTEMLDAARRGERPGG
jgi:alcohol dehydrogenase class IV